MVELEQPAALWMVAHGVPLRNMAVMACCVPRSAGGLYKPPPLGFGHPLRLVMPAGVVVFAGNNRQHAQHHAVDSVQHAAVDVVAVRKARASLTKRGLLRETAFAS